MRGGDEAGGWVGGGWGVWVGRMDQKEKQTNKKRKIIHLQQ